MLGDASNTTGYTSIRVGNTSYSPSNDYDLATKKYVDDNAGGSSGGLGSYGVVNSTGTAASATGTDAVSIGEGTTAAGNTAVAIGPLANSGTAGGIAIGYLATPSGGYSPISIGYYSDASSSGCAVGPGFNSSTRCYAGNTASAFGYLAYASGLYSCSIGAFTDSTGQNSGAFGYSAQASGSNATAVGNGATANANNKFVLGNSSITDLRCQDTSISAVSDIRDKTQIETLSVGLDFVNAIEPKAFYKNNRADYYSPVYTDHQLLEDSSLTQSYVFNQADYDAATEKFTKREFGFVSQDVAAQLPAEYSDARVSFNEIEPTYGFDVQHFTMGDMTPILWKALRELSDKHDQLQTDYDALLARVEALENA